MPRWGMVIDLDKCTGCQTCTVACRAENNVPFAGPEETGLGRAMFWHQVLSAIEGEYPHVRLRFVPRPCQQCDNAPCIKVCPVGATYKDEEGIIRMDYGRCIGCRYCVTACPYGARYFNWYNPRWPEPMAEYLNPDVRPGPGGVVQKCTFCIHRLRQAQTKAGEEGRELTDAEAVLLPACNRACPASARYFGDLDEPHSTVSMLARSRRAFRLLEELGTEPKVIYLQEEQL